MDLFPKLFLPGKINSMELKNRLVAAPITTYSFGNNIYPSPQMIEFYSARAHGGVGLVIVEATMVSGSGLALGSGRIRIDNDDYVPGLQKLSGAIKKNGAKAAIQLSGRGQQFIPNREQKDHPKHEYHALSRLTKEDLDYLKESVIKATIRAKDAGFDAVEFHAAHISFLNLSLSPFSNRRNDEYGGNAANRARLMCEIIALTRQEVGPNYPLFVRVNASEFMEGGKTIEDTIIQAKLMEEAGIDAIHVSGGNYHTLQWHAPAYYMDPYTHLFHAGEVKHRVDVPIIAVGKIKDLSVAEQALTDGKADFIALGRPLLADSDLPNKAQDGRLDDIRPCIYCNNCHNSIFGRVQMDFTTGHTPSVPSIQPLTGPAIPAMASQRTFDQQTRLCCTVNPGLFSLEISSMKPAKRPKNIMVVGGGLAGMEVARVLAERGHKVNLYEKTNQLGGQWNVACQEVLKRDDFPRLTSYLIRAIEKAGVEVKLDLEVSPDLIKSEKPEVLILATGAIPATPNVPGVDHRNVVQANDVITGKVKCGEKVVIIGGRYIGMGVADFLACQGKKVSLVDLQPIGMDIGVTLYKGLMERLVNLGVCFYPNSPLYEIKQNGVYIEYNHELLFLKADTVVLAVGVTPQKDLIERLKGLTTELYAIGDCVEPGNAQKAISNAAELGIKI